MYQYELKNQPAWPVAKRADFEQASLRLTLLETINTLQVARIAWRKRQ